MCVVICVGIDCNLSVGA